MKIAPISAVIVTVCMLATSAHSKIGWTLDECVKEYGPIVEKYGDNDQSLPEYEFLKDNVDVTVIMINGRVAKITISPPKPFSKQMVVQTLQNYSSERVWHQRPHTEKETTAQFLFTPSPGHHEYYRTPDAKLYGFVNSNWVGDRPYYVAISVPNFQDSLQKYRADRKRIAEQGVGGQPATRRESEIEP